jgi:hypothetical protein
MANQLSQLPVEVLVLSGAPITVQLSQLPMEVLMGSAGITPVQVSQLPVEVLIIPGAGAGGMSSAIWMGDSGGAIWVE